MTIQNNWERRWHPLLREWVILAATTSERPWSGARIENPDTIEPEFDPSCYLCPGVVRASSIKNPEYKKPFAFTNDFASFSLNAPDVHRNEQFEIAEPVHGTCRVICFTPKHNTTLAEMSREELYEIYQLWQDEFRTLSKHETIKNVLIFENKGKVIGVSNPHPHGQIYATGFVPKIVATELESFVSYYNSHKKHLLEELVKHELKVKDRIVYENEYFIACIPFFARYAFETYIIPKKHVSNITELTSAETQALTEIHKLVITKFDNLYNYSFPCMTLLHNSPTDGNPDNSLFHFHIEFYPPMRAPDKLKYFAGFESGGGNIINPIVPEAAAQRLREAPSTHYKLNQ